MPQESKSRGASGDSIAHDQSEDRNLEGWAPDLSDITAAREALNQAFDYRGDVTFVMRAGEPVVGYVFERDLGGDDFDAWSVRLYPTDRDEKVRISMADVERVEFTGKDTAAGKSFEKWMDRYRTKLVERAKAKLEAEPSS
ncbi:MAG: hypothetical protein AAFR38_07920 [Planctomycetota bacterium]